MKALTGLLISFILLYSVCPVCLAGKVETVPDRVPDTAEEAEQVSAGRVITDVPGDEPGMTPRHKRIMRDLNREYQAGGLTKTEYIQRKRELKALEK